MNSSAATAFLLALALLAAPAAAQVQAPSMVEDELPPDEPAPRVRPDRRPLPARPPPAPAPLPASEGPPAPAVPPAPPASAVPAQKRAPEKRAAPADAGTVAPALPGVSMSPDEARKLQRPIEPVRVGYPRILELWQERRAALREQDLPRATAAEERILESMRELGIENLTPFAAALVREADRALGARDADDAQRHATLAVSLAPALPEGHLALARARLAKEPGRPLPAISAGWAGLAAAAREPHVRHAFLGDLGAAALAGLLVAAAVTIAVLFLRRARLFLHDFRHLPVVRGGAPVQAVFLAVVLLAMPVALRLGPFAVLFALALAAWLYLGWAERAVATAALLAVLALPALARLAGDATVWAGTLGDAVHQLEHGADGDALAARLEARASASGLPAPALMAVGRHHKRRGDLDAAQRWYERAAEADARSSEVQVNLGNVLFLRGDLDGAKATYLAATDRSADMTTLAAAHYNLSKLYLRLAAVEQSSEARKKAQQEDPAYVARYGSDNDFRANRYLLDVVVPPGQLRALARSDGTPQALGEAVRAELAGAIPARLWPWLPLGLLAGLWILALAGWRLAPSRPCSRCGRSACRRCDGVTGDLCGQCVNVYVKQGVVDARDRLRKEAQVDRHRRGQAAAARTLAVLGGGAGHLFLGAPVRGALLVLGLAFLAVAIGSWDGLVPPPRGSSYATIAKLAVAIPLAIALYAWAVRDAFRRSGE